MFYSSKDIIIKNNDLHHHPVLPLPTSLQMQTFSIHLDTSLVFTIIVVILTLVSAFQFSQLIYQLLNIYFYFYVP